MTKAFGNGATFRVGLIQMRSTRTPAATQITLFWRSVDGFGSEQVAAH